MSSLGEKFPQAIRAELAKANLVPGAVIRIPVNDTTPPKIKYLVVISVDPDKFYFSTIFVNTEVNPNVFNTVELQNLQHYIEVKNCPFVETNCYADCSKIKERSHAEVTAYITKYPDAHLGQLPEDDFNKIRALLTNASTIPPFFRKKYGLRK
jgi:hypothetical protein